MCFPGSTFLIKRLLIYCAGFTVGRDWDPAAPARLLVQRVQQIAASGVGLETDRLPGVQVAAHPVFNGLGRLGVLEEIVVPAGAQAQARNRCRQRSAYRRPIRLT